jgi:phosphate:Na+ symporter
MGVVIALALQGLVNLEGGIALALGANIGTCATAGLAAIGKPREAIRVAVAHVLFKIVGVLLIVGVIPAFADLIRQISPVADPALTGMDKLAAETPRQIANAHTVFNIGIALLFLPFSAVFARFCEWVVPDKPLDEKEIVRTRDLDRELMETPSLALDRARMEIGHMGESVQKMLSAMMPAVLTGDREALKDVAKMDDEVDILYGEIVTYLGDLSRRPLSEEQMRNFMGLMDAVKELENIGDIVETDIVALGQKRIDTGISISAETRKVLNGLHAEVAAAVAGAVEALANDDQRAAQDVIASKLDINRLVEAAEEHLTARLIAEEPGRLQTYAIEVDVIEKLKRIYYFAKRIAKAIVPPEIIEKAA